jgi:radical SAM-linked protein
MARRQPEANQDPVVQRVRLRYAKRGPMRFTSHRDFARAFERALLRANVPIAYSQGFSPHPKVSYASAAPTGVASEAEYLEIGLRRPVDVEDLRRALDSALSPGLDVLSAVESPLTGGGSLADRIDASSWRIELPGVTGEQAQAAVRAFLEAAEVLVERLTKQGRRTFDARAAVHRLSASAAPSEVGGTPCAILELVVRQVTPTVRPDDVLSGLRVVAGLEPPDPPRATRLAQGALTAQDVLVDPLEGSLEPSAAADRQQAVIGASTR